MGTGEIKLRECLKRAEETKDIGNGLFCSEDIRWHFEEWRDILPKHLNLLIDILKKRHFAVFKIYLQFGVAFFSRKKITLSENYALSDVCVRSHFGIPAK